jgi:Ca-activated chloride channel homolog
MDDADLALVLAFDCSASVTYEEFNLLAGGCAAALRDPEVAAGLTGGPLRASLCALVLWSGSGAQETLVQWTRVSDQTSLEAFATAVNEVPRIVRAGLTAIGEALLFCAALLEAAPAPARRRIIDVAGDGRSNDGTPPGPVRDRLAAAGITINGLCVLHEEPDLLETYEREVIGGPGAFALTCADYPAFADAMRQKLLQEVALSMTAGSVMQSI